MTPFLFVLRTPSDATKWAKIECYVNADYAGPKPPERSRACTFLENSEVLCVGSLESCNHHRSQLVITLITPTLRQPSYDASAIVSVEEVLESLDGLAFPLVVNLRLAAVCTSDLLEATNVSDTSNVGGVDNGEA